MIPVGQAVIPVAQAVRLSGAALAQAGLASPQAEARTLTAFVLGVEPSRLALAEALTGDQARSLNQLVARRQAGQPLQHLTGRAFFRTVSVHVGPGVFIPRPETELLAGWAIDQVRAGWGRVVELCAGSGAISLAIAAESRPLAQWAVEREDPAFAYLVGNLSDGPVRPVHRDMAEALPELDGGVDLVVANPPYIPEGERDRLPLEVGRDPAEALFSGADGLDATALVAQTARRLLRPGGLVGSEHGDDQADQARRIFTGAGFVEVTTHPDLTGRPRFVTARRPN